MSDLEASLRYFLAQEARESGRGSRSGVFPRDVLVGDDSSFVAGIVDVAAAAWAALEEQDPRRAAELADPRAPANRAAYLDSLEDGRGSLA